MSLYPDDIIEGKCIFESFEKCWDISESVALEGIHKGISYSTFHIGFSDSLIGDSETRSHKYLIERSIFSGNLCDFFLTENIDFPS